jgi:hypothetical protein
VPQGPAARTPGGQPRWWKPAPVPSFLACAERAFPISLIRLIQSFLLDRGEFARLRCIVTKLVH